ncbi:vascular cell adhesion protein 1-like [Pempheris klunzingeri]|uniref:vascular cell adhesion protein 1-like n=1 Tax=Pempheris klunzingeri TaxID=3127111 RepID=UPI003980A451
MGALKTNGTTISWTVDSMTEWDTSALCYYNKNDSDDQCFTTLPVTVYQPPENVSVSFVNHTGPMFEGHQYTLQCTVQDVAPVENLTVTFYRGQTALERLQSNSSNTKKTPVTEIFTLDISASKEHDGVQYWCEAELQLGPEGPPYPPVVRSQNISAAVYYKPQLEASSHLDQITITEGDPLQLNCSAVGNPGPSYTWTSLSATLSPSNGSVLTISSVTSADEGPYTCSVTNDVGTVTVDFKVVVQGLELTSTRLPPTTTTTTRATTTKTTTSTTTASTATPKNTQTTTVLNCSTSSKPIHRFIMCFMFLFSALVYVSCADQPVFTPSRLVLKYGDPAFAMCSVCQHACVGTLFGLEKSMGALKTNGTTISWTVDSMTEWDTSALCYYTKNDSDDQCCTTLPVTVYQPPENVSVSFVNHTGPMFEGHQYTLQCTVQDVAPVENLTVTFYRGQTALERLQSNSINTKKTPVTEIFTLDISASKEHDGVQYWCEAELQLGPEGPPYPPVVRSQNISAAVYYKPQLERLLDLNQITITEGDPLQLDCSAVGNPGPSYTWMFPSATLPAPNVSVLTISSVTSADEGPYTCSVTNDVGTVTVDFKVVVQADYTITTIVGMLIMAVVVIVVVTVVYICYYRNHRMGQYNLRDVFHFHKRQQDV